MNFRLTRRPGINITDLIYFYGEITNVRFQFILYFDFLRFEGKFFSVVQFLHIWEGFTFHRSNSNKGFNKRDRGVGVFYR